MPKCYILSGAPLSGKSTWARRQNYMPVLSCDILRQDYHNGKYVYDPAIEEKVWEDFYRRVSLFTQSFIIDNTNCKKKYIDKIKSVLSSDFEIIYVKFEIPLWKSYIRNVERWLMTGKWIPFKVIKNMKKNYKELWMS